MGKEVTAALLAAIVVGLAGFMWSRWRTQQAAAGTARGAVPVVGRSYLNSSGSPDVVRGMPNVVPAYEAQWLASNQVAIEQGEYVAERDFWG